MREEWGEKFDGEGEECSVVKMNKISEWKLGDKNTNESMGRCNLQGETLIVQRSSDQLSPTGKVSWGIS